MAQAAKATKRAEMTAGEWQTRVQLAACYRIFAMLGLDDLIYTHISARVPGPEDHFLLNPFGLLYDEVTASNLVKVDLEGRVVDEGAGPINPAGFVIHSAIHAGRPDVGCVIHLHTIAGSAVSAQKNGLLPLTQTAMLYWGRIAYHAYEGLALLEGEKARLVSDLGDNNLMILRNHGTLTVGRTIPEAFIYMFYLDRACRMQVAALAGNQPLEMPSAEIQDLAAKQAKAGFGWAPGEREFEALVRKLDRTDRSYRD